MSSQNPNAVNVTVNVNAPPPIIIRSQPGCLIQVIFFLCIGWWLGAISISLAYLFFLTLLGIPIGVMILNKIPYLLALRNTELTISYAGVNVPQHNIFIRAIWFLFFGDWLTALWLIVAYWFACTIIGMPIGFWMFDKAPGILTLRRR